MTKASHLRLSDVPELIAQLKRYSDELIPFNKLAGFELITAGAENTSLRFTMRPDLVGNFIRGMLHGGVTAAVLDVAGGLVSMSIILERHLGAGEPIEVQIGRLVRVSTIDLRVDYLRPGFGKAFHTRSEILRAGSRVAVVRSDLLNDTDELIASATAAYTLS